MWSSRHPAVRILRGATAAAAVAAIGYEIGENLRRPEFSLADYLSYFTVQTNLFAAVILACGAVALLADSRRWAWLRGAAALYLIVTGLVYAFLLAPSPLSPAGPWNNIVVHRIVPIVMVLDWLLLAPRRPVPYRSALGWLGYPALFLCYTLARGHLTGFYPYDFLDPGRGGGYGRVALFSLILLAGMAVLAVLLAAWTRRRARRP